MRNKEVKIGGLSEAGDFDEINQDSIFYKFLKINQHNVGLFIVADGMGGLSHGEEISNLIVDYFNRWWTEILCPFVKSDGFSFNTLYEMMDTVIIEVNKKAIKFSEQSGAKSGSTLSLLLVIDNRYLIKNIGDSRIYLVRKGKKTQLTEDQTLVSQMVKNKQITKEQAKYHEKRNLLTMCLGVTENIEVFSSEGKVRNGDIFLVCSDGFYNYANDKEVVPIIRNRDYNDFNQKAGLLRSTIPVGEARDNVSIIIAELWNKKESIITFLSTFIILIFVFGIFFLWRF